MRCSEHGAAAHHRRIPTTHTVASAPGAAHPWMHRCVSQGDYTSDSLSPSPSSTVRYEGVQGGLGVQAMGQNLPPCLLCLLLMLGGQVWGPTALCPAHGASRDRSPQGRILGRVALESAVWEPPPWACSTQPHHSPSSAFHRGCSGNPQLHTSQVNTPSPAFAGGLLDAQVEVTMECISSSRECADFVRTAWVQSTGAAPRTPGAGAWLCIRLVFVFQVSA